MRAVIESFFSSSLMMIGFFIINALIFALILYKNKLARPGKKIVLWAVSIVYIGFILVFFIFINPMITGFGYAGKLFLMTQDNKYICVIDKFNESDDSEDSFRLHVIDPVSGLRLYRKVLGRRIYNAYQKDGMLLLKRTNDYALYDIASGRIKNLFGTDVFPLIFSEYFGKGIESYQFNERLSVFEVLAKTGYKFIVDPFTLKISDKKPSDDEEPQYYIDRTYIRKKVRNQYRNIINLSNFDWNDKIKRVQDEKNFSSQELPGFLEPEILDVLSDNSFALLSYETTDKNNFFITCISFDQKVLWRISQSDLKTRDWINKKPKFEISSRYGNNFIFNSGGYVISVNSGNGVINWKIKL